MRPFTTHTGIAAPMPRDNIDTDQIIPSREMKSVSKTGLRAGLFAGQRYTQGRTPNPDFILNQSPYDHATILLSGQNFGCGSSREHAVWALRDFGFRAVIAQSFGEIFYNNCIANGVLPIQLEGAKIIELGSEVTINLPAQTVNGNAFDIPASDKQRLIEGLDPVALTLKHASDIDAYFAADAQARPWLY